VTLTILPPCPHAALIRRLHARLHPRVQALPVTVREVERRGWSATGARPGWWGLTVVEQGACLISLHRDHWAPSHLYHEYGHVIAARNEGHVIGLLRVEDWPRWVAFYTAHRGQFPTSYARNEGPAEGWAECAPEVLGGIVPPGYRPVTKAIRAEIRGLVGL
jgi:hypothetical protein